MNSNNIQTSGGIFSQHFIESIAQEKVNHPACNPETFTYAYQERINDRELEARIASAWADLVERWDVVEREFNALDITALRQRWLRPLFSQLGFNLEFNRADIVLENDFRFPISFLGRCGTTEFTVPIHTVLYHSDTTLEIKATPGKGIKAMAPHDMVQRYLNLSKVHNWGIVTDGVNLRLLRDFFHTYTRGYTEFDLQGIFSTRDFTGFKTMFRLLHASRFVVPEGKESSPIDDMYEDALSLGVAVGNKLRGNVQAAIETFANGFLVSAPGFMDQVRAQADGSQHLYRDILVTIYRILFLLFAEQRGMLPGRGSLYQEEFSLTALRTLAEQPRGDDSNFDLWEKLKTTFSMVEHGVPQLNIYPYNGALFSMARTPLLTPSTADSAPRCRNDYLLTAIRHLTTVDQDNVMQRISYSDLSVEEIGSIYESLLEITPRISDAALVVDNREILPNTFFLDPRGKGRKTTGSYYTPPSLVNELIKSALEPVMLSRLRDVVPGYDPEMVEALKENERGLAEEALLRIKVVDPAAGSGAFLIAANNKLGLELARIRSGSIFPPDAVIRHARRDVLSHCIHGVDLNPMAVELCKVSLWINAAVEDAPLNFLDHHIQCGNSLVGATPDLLKQGIPDDAYNPVTGDDRDYSTRLKRQNRTEREGQGRLPFVMVNPEEPEDLAAWNQVRQLAGSQPGKAEAAYHKLLASKKVLDERLPFDLWTAAFFVPLKSDSPVLTTHDVRQAEADPRLVPNEVVKAARYLAEEHHFFHWHLAFPEVFDKDGRGGFDVVLGNPPWERVKLQEKEFFEGKDDSVTNAPNAAGRKRLIANLERSNPDLWRAYLGSLKTAESESNFLRTSGYYPLGGRGDINLFQVFAERMRHLINSQGRAGVIVPTGIATDDTCKFLFSDLVNQNQIASLFDFENRKGLFPEVHRSYKFSLLTLRGIESGQGKSADFAFFLLDPADLHDPEKVFELTAEDFALLNPNTRTCPIFRSRTDANLTRRTYREKSILVNEEIGENPWGVEFLRMFDMANDSHLFKLSAEENNVKLYEAKLIWHYDHRWNTFEGDFIRQTTEEEKEDPNFTVASRYWVSKKIVEEKTKGWKYSWFFVHRDVTNITNERTSIFTIVPRLGVSGTAPVMFVKSDSILTSCLLSNFNSFALDFFIRQKVGGMHLSYNFLRQFPVIKPSGFSPDLKTYIIQRVIELVYTARDLKEFADDIWLEASNSIKRSIEDNYKKLISRYPLIINSKPITLNGKDETAFPFPPFIWDDEHRFQLRCDLDALFGHLYNLTRDEFDYILETFPIVKRNDGAKYGEYRTKRVILEKFDALANDPMLEGACVPLNERVSVLKNPPIPQPSAMSVPVAPKPAAPLQPKSENKPPEKPSKPASAVSGGQPALFATQPESPAATSPKLSDYSLYRCPLCDKHLAGFALKDHTREVHQGKDPGYKKIGKS